MNTHESIIFRMEEQVAGVEITPATIGFSRFNRFNKEVEDFVKGGTRDIALDDVHVSIESGSYLLRLLLPVTLLQSVEPDVRRLETGSNLDGMAPARQTIIKDWQRQSRRNPEFKVTIESPGSRFRPVRISSQSDYHVHSDNQWVQVEKYLIGQVMDMGGKTSANVHLIVKGLPKPVVLESSVEYLRSQPDNMLYHDVQVRVRAEQNIQTRELRNVKLGEFIGKPPVYDEQELTQAIRKGTAAWADVENISQWVAEQRGGYDA